MIGGWVVRIRNGESTRVRRTMCGASSLSHFITLRVTDIYSSSLIVVILFRLNVPVQKNRVQSGWFIPDCFSIDLGTQKSIATYVSGSPRYCGSPEDHSNELHQAFLLMHGGTQFGVMSGADLSWNCVGNLQDS